MKLTNVQILDIDLHTYVLGICMLFGGTICNVVRHLVLVNTCVQAYTQGPKIQFTRLILDDAIKVL